MTIEAKKKGRSTKKPPIEELSELYAKHTAKELAKHYDVSVSTVQRWIADYRKQEAQNA